MLAASRLLLSFHFINNPFVHCLISFLPPFLKAFRYWTRYGKQTPLSGRYHFYCPFLGFPCVSQPSFFIFRGGFHGIMNTRQAGVCISGISSLISNITFFLDSFLFCSFKLPKCFRKAFFSNTVKNWQKLSKNSQSDGQTRT